MGSGLFEVCRRTKDLNIWAHFVFGLQHGSKFLMTLRWLSLIGNFEVNFLRPAWEACSLVWILRTYSALKKIGNVCNVCTTSHCGAFALPSLPWKRNSTFLFIIVGVDVAGNNIKVFSVSMEMHQCVPSELWPSYNVFSIDVNNYEYYILWVCVSVFLPLLSGMQIASFLDCVLFSSAICLAVPYFSTLPLKLHDYKKKRLCIKCVFWCSLQICPKHFSF